MRYLLATAVLLAGLSASAFDSERWFEKRESKMADALRLCAAYSNCVARLEVPAEGVIVPMETFDDGSVKLSIGAKRAQFFLDTNFVWAEDVVIRKFDDTQTEISRVEAKNCVIDRVSKSGWVQGTAKIFHGKTEFSGSDVYFSSGDGYVISTADSSIVSTDLKFGGAL